MEMGYGTLHGAAGILVKTPLPVYVNFFFTIQSTSADPKGSEQEHEAFDEKSLG